MAVNIPSDHLTRPAASKVYNRSKRALERDLEDAYVAGDENVLAAFKLITNDDVIREAKNVSTELVQQLKMDGKNPTWCVSEAWLESTYGRKGESKREQSQNTDGHTEEEFRRTKPNGTKRTFADEREGTNDPGHDTIDNMYLPDDTEFLKERIRTLEREKMDEIKRHEKRESKLFQQLEVKDKQISAWDEVAQGITKGLATGQIVSTLPPGSEEQSNGSESGTEAGITRNQSPADTGDKRHETSSIVEAEVVERKRPRMASTAKATPGRQQKATRKKQPARKKKKTKKPARNTKKRNWLNTPIGELLSRR